MAFVDTQIISYKYKKNAELFDGDIKGLQISSIVALEFLGIMVKNENRAKMYPFNLNSFHTCMPLIFKDSKRGLEFGKKITDKLIIDFNGEFDSIVIYSNETISNLINTQNLETLLLFAKNSLNKNDFKYFKERAQFLIDNEITVVPVTQKIISKMQCIYQDIKSKYNVKNNYRNSFMDLIIVATALEKKEQLISGDNELNKVLKKCCQYLTISTSETGISTIDCYDKYTKKNVNADNKGYINNSWHIICTKPKIV